MISKKEGEEQMRKVFLDDLPRRKGSTRKFNWLACIGFKVKFIYEDLEGEIEIINYNKESEKLSVRYCERDYDITSYVFTKGALGKIVGKINVDYMYAIGDIIQTSNSDLKILEQIRIGKKNSKGYRYKCQSCEHIDTKYESHISSKELTERRGCPVCGGGVNNKIKIGYNDMWTTNPELAKMLANPEDGYKYKQYSSKKVDWKCLGCEKIIKNKLISNINKRGLSCPRCSDGIRYPEKFMYSTLSQLKVDFEFQRMFEWSNRRIYDFYIPSQNLIIETHGSQHTEGGQSFAGIGGRNVKEEIENDILKMGLAIKNNIKYIIIDCRESNMEYISDSITKSEMSNIFNLSNVNWIECDKGSHNSFVRKSCELWSSGIKNTTEIGKVMKIDKQTIIKYLKRGVKHNWCDYDPKEEMRKSAGEARKKNYKKVICLTTGEVFESISEASRYFKTSDSHISQACNGKRKSAGKHPKTNAKLRWMYYE
ncbi:hypothetical protein ABEP50_15940 [Priestia megaterium]